MTHLASWLSPCRDGVSYWPAGDKARAIAAYEGKFIVRFGAKNSRFPQVCSCAARPCAEKFPGFGHKPEFVLPAVTRMLPPLSAYCKEVGCQARMAQAPALLCAGLHRLRPLAHSDGAVRGDVLQQVRSAAAFLDAHAATTSRRTWRHQCSASDHDRTDDESDDSFVSCRACC